MSSLKHWENGQTGLSVYTWASPQQETAGVLKAYENNSTERVLLFTIIA